MKIVAINWRDIAHPLAGGAEVLIDRLLSGLAARGHEVTLVCGGPVSEHDYEVVDAGGTYSQYIRAPWVCTARLSRADLIIDVENGLPYFTPIWRRRPSVCLVHHVHAEQWGTRFPAPIARVARAVERDLMPLLYRRRLFIAVSASTAHSLREIGVDPKHIRVIESGVDVPGGPIPSESPSPLFVAVTRLVPHKRVDLLLDVWRRVQPVTGGRFVVIGTGPELAALRRSAAGIPGVELAGWLSEEEKERILGEAWFLVHGARHEGWGMVLMEAAAVGTPSVVADAPGVRDAVIDGITGVVVRAPEHLLPDALARAWVDLAADPTRRRRLGSQARTRATDFGWDRVCESWDGVLEEAVARSSVTRPHREHRRRTGSGRWRQQSATVGVTTRTLHKGNE